MSTTSATDFARERQLIEKLEFRIASADTSAKLQNILSKFLPALLLKLGTDDPANRNLTIKICQYIHQRLKTDTTIQLPVEDLSATSRDTKSAFVRQFSLLFLQQGLTRLSDDNAIAVLPGVLRTSVQGDDNDAQDGKVFAIAIDLLLKVLRVWTPPEPGSKEDDLIQQQFGLSLNQVKTLAKQLSYFVLFDPKEQSPSHVISDLQPIFQNHFSGRSLIIPNLARFVATKVFSDEERFVPATALSVDANSSANTRADMMFKQCNFDLESDSYVDAAFNLYRLGKPRLQTRILTLLAKSKTSTSRLDDIVSIVETQLAEPVMNLEGTKLRAAMFSYLIWASRVSPNLAQVAHRLQTTLKEFIESQGWPSAVSLTLQDNELRAQAYESIGLLAMANTIGPDVSVDSMALDDDDSLYSLVSWLFASLRCDTARNVRHNIEESLSRLLTRKIHINADQLERFRSLLLWNVMAKEGEEDPTYNLPTVNSARYPAIRFANKLLPFSDTDARVIDLIAMGSDKRELVEEGNRGLDPSWHLADLRIAGATNEQLEIPSFDDFLTRASEIAAYSDAARAALENPAALAGLTSFAQSLIAVKAWANSTHAVKLDSSWQQVVGVTLDNELEARRLFKQFLADQPADVKLQILRSCFLGLSKGSSICGQNALHFTSLMQNSTLERLSQESISHLEIAVAHTSTRQVACRLLGIVLSVDIDSIHAMQSELEKCKSWQQAFGLDLAKIEGALMKIGYAISRAILRGHIVAIQASTKDLWSICNTIIAESSDKTLREAAYVVVGQLALCLPPKSTTIEEPDRMIDHMLTDAKKENEPAVSSLGRLLSASWQALPSQRQEGLLTKLFDLHEIRKPEFQFTVGEALAVTSLKFRSSSTLTDRDVDIPQLREDSTMNSSLYSSLLDAVLEKVKTTKPALRKASAIWLLSLIQFCTDDEMTRPRLRECQSAFSGLLVDRDDVVQETGSRGLGIVYEKGDKPLREELIRDLVQSFTGNNAKTSGTVTEDTQLFEPGALPTENGQSVTTYKDIVSLAQEMGDPSLVYRFMNLASNNAIWSSRAAFGRFGLSGVLAESNYLKENKKFYPKLYRYRFDPNPNVQRSMEDIWKALVNDPNAVIEENFDLIMEDLLKSVLYGREWRVREASCAAIASLVQGRDVEKLEKYFDDVWKVAFKVLDDIKETVRVAAMKLCKTLTNMLIRNLEVGEGTTKRANVMLHHAMPFLLQQMDGAAGQEVQQYAIITLLDVVKKAPPKSLKSYAPSILETFVNSLSSLEHESINYLHLNADKYGLTAEKLDNMRVSSIGASPISQAIEKCLESLTMTTTSISTNGPNKVVMEEESIPLQQALKRLEASYKSAIGLPSRVGLSRVMITLVVRHHVAFKPYADKFVRLTRKNVLDRNTTISQSFSTALAYLLRLASDKEVKLTAAYAQKLYFESQEVSHRAVAGEILQAISKASSDVFMNFATSFLPFAFIGRNDLDGDTKERFEAAWKDNVAGSRVLRLYLAEISELLSKHLESNLWPVRHACCFAVADLVTKLESDQVYTDAEAEKLWPLMKESLNGKTWEGKETVVESWPKFVKGAKPLWPQRSTEMIKIALREAKRNNVGYRPHALSALAEFVNIRKDIDISEEVVTYLGEIVDELVAPQDSMELDNPAQLNDHSRQVLFHSVRTLWKNANSGVSDTIASETLSSTITCMFAAIRRTSTKDVLDRSLVIAQKIHDQQLNAAEYSLYSGLKQLLEENSKEEDDEVENSAFQLTPKLGTGVDAPEITANQGQGAIFVSYLNALASVAIAADNLKSHASAAESLRRLRVETCQKLSTSKAISPQTRETLQQVFASWLEEERSRPLRLLIQQGLDACKATTSSE